jgi:class 3 adenylate cyclase/tetratricopeptide (TPR) repeat protein
MSAEWELDAPRARWRELDATCCFVDISGFTALSERLAKRGRIGAEELTEVLNHVFSRMLDVAYSKGGALLKFGGDALLLAYTGDDHPRLAAEGAVAMRAALREARTLPTSVGRVNLKMSVGVHTGSFHLFRVGMSHRELLITGPAASETTRMEATADAGEIVVSTETAQRLPKGAVGQPKGDGHLLRWRRVVEEGPGPIEARTVPDRAVESSVPVALRLRLAQRGGEAEHRLASVGFVKFMGTDDLIASDGPAATADALDAIVQSVQYAADREGVTFLASDIDANGGKIILVTGVPATQEDDEGRMLRAARTVMDHPLPLPVRIGVNRGHVFSGDIGTPYRRTFTIMGDTVNLAARLMAAAKPGEIYATGAVLDQSRTQFATEALEPFYVKGKSEPVQAYQVGQATGTKSETFGELPFRGRDKELALLRDAFEAAEAGHGGTVLIEAERGAGKTRLVSEFVESASPAQVLWLQGEAHGTGIPYLPLRVAMRSVLGIEAKDRLEAGRQLATAVARHAPDLLPLAPLLAPMVDAEVPSTPESEAVADEFVRQRIADLVVAIVDSAVATPLLFVAEDAHWFDETSAEICTRLASDVGHRRWLFVATRRLGAGGFGLPNPNVSLGLTLLSDDAALELVDEATDTAPLRPHERDAIVSRAGGNPLFLEELLRIVRDTSIESLPDTLDAVAMREIDSLPTTPRRVLRLASVLGRSFERSLLDRLLDSESVDVGADPLNHLEAQLVADENGDHISFRHALLQEAAYQSLPFRQRLALHIKAGEAIERAAKRPVDVAPLLSFHFVAAQEWQRTWQYARMAADVARAAHAPGETATHLERAITAARRLGNLETDELVSVFVDLGRSLELLGEFESADDAYRHAAATSNHEPLLRAEMAHRRAHLRNEFLRRPAAAIRQVRAARAELDPAEPEAAGLRALLLAEEAIARERQGRMSEGVVCARLAVVESEQSDNKKALIASLDVLNALLFQTGSSVDLTQMERAVALCEELGDEVKLAIMLNNLGNMASVASQWDYAVDSWTRSSQVSAKVADLVGAAIADANLAELRVNQGRLQEAESLLAPARRTLDSFGHRAMAAFAQMHLGRARAFLGDVDAGLADIRSAVTAFDEVGAPIESLEALCRVAEVLVFAGRFREAGATLVEARDLDKHSEETHFSALVDRVELTLLLQSGEHSAAMAKAQVFLDHAQRVDAVYDTLVMLTLLERFDVSVTTPASGSAPRPSPSEVATLRQRLGIVALPMLADVP